MNENKTNINCLITLFATLSKNTYKIRLCEIWNLAFFIYKDTKNKKNYKKWQKLKENSVSI